MTSSSLARLQYLGLRKPPADPCQPCPACGGLECLCRPRFFAGQLLTEEDLNRLDRYIVKKNQLHNRYVHGWGVACGLEVVCHPCEGTVLVRPGYALSGCGDDIVVCKEEPVDVCKLIGECCSPEPAECEAPRARPAGCDDLEHRWVLAICYRETPSRGVAALKGSGTSQCSAKTVQPCEPTVTCEGYYFKVYQAPQQDPKETSFGAMIDRFLECYLAIFQGAPSPPADNASLDQVRQWCCDVREFLLALWARSPGVDCTLLDTISELCPEPKEGMTPQQYFNQMWAPLVEIVGEYLIYCMCSALLPPCPEPATDPCVPLATIVVRRGDCAILRICNLSNRKFLTTFPNLQYWFSWFPYVRRLRQLLERRCCQPIRLKEELKDRPVRPITAKRAFRKAAYTRTQARQSADVTGSLFEALTRTGKLTTLSALSLDALGLADEQGQPFVSDEQLANPLASILADELVGPLAANAFPAGTAALFTATGGADAVRLARENQRRDEEVQGLRTQVGDLQKTIETQKLMIDGLASRLGKTT